MGRLKEIYRKKDGVNMIKTWAKAGVLPYAVWQLILSGTSNKALELLRNGVAMKIKNKLGRKYLCVLDEFDKQHHAKLAEGAPSKKVWICWMQGMENAPSVVQICYSSIKKHLQDREVILITAENRKDFVELPSFIEERYENGVITHTHLSDILRVELLAKYGGTWIDATVFCTGGSIPHYMLDGNFFVFQNLKPGADGQVLNMSSWFITAQASHKFLLAVRSLLYAYWEKMDYMVDYFLLHHFFMIVADHYKEEWRDIPQYPNSLPHILLLNLFEQYNEEKFAELKRICPFHKLSYKYEQEQEMLENTYLSKIIRGGGDLKLVETKLPLLFVCKEWRVAA